MQDQAELPTETRTSDNRLRERLWARFEALPFDITRIRKHLADGHVALGDFLQQYDAAVQAETLTRPASRSTLVRGDAECFVASDGTRCAWEVAAVVDGRAYLAVSLSGEGRAVSLLSVAWPLSDANASALCKVEPALHELLGGKSHSEATAWAHRRHCLDLWDWREGAFLAATGSGLPGDGVIVRATDGAAMPWEVDTPEGVFAWTQAGGISAVSRIPGKGEMPDASVIRALFARHPSLQDA